MTLTSHYPDASSLAAADWYQSDLIIQYLEHLRIEFVFGVPGGAIEPLYDALARSSRRGGPRAIVARHEAGAAFMADGYARETGKIGVVCSTTGPGATNLITGVASAMADHIPMLVITAQTALPNFGQRALQDSSCTAINTVGMFRHCTRYNTLVSHPAQLERKLMAALSETQGPPAGPSHISIPVDILRSPTIQQPIQLQPDSLLRQHALIDIRALKQLSDLIGQAQRLVFFIGSEAGSAVSAILQLAELLNAPIVTTPAGKSWVSSFHPNYRGVFGFAGHDSARKALTAPDIDLVLAIGTRLDELESGRWDETALLNNKLVHIDVTAEAFVRSPMARLHVCGNLPCIFDYLVEQVLEARRWGRQWRGDQKTLASIEQLNVEATPAIPAYPSSLSLLNPASLTDQSLPLKPQYLMQQLSQHCPSHTRFLVDAGNSWAWVTHYLHNEGIGKQRIAMGFGAMAWSLGAAIGTALAAPNEPVVCIIGDGSYLMSAQELSVAVAERLAIVVVVLNDQALGMVKHGQRLGGAEAIGFELPTTNFALMAQALGAQGLRIEQPAELATLDWNALFQRPGPTLLDVIIDPEAIPPMGERMKTLKQD